MFHIVFALKAVSNYSVVQCYHELSHRIGLALKHEEKRVGYLNQQTKCLIAAMDEVDNLIMKNAMKTKFIYVTGPSTFPKKKKHTEIKIFPHKLKNFISL